MRVVSKKLQTGQQWTPPQLNLVSTIVHNAGIYNAIIAAGLFWAGSGGDPSGQVARVLLLGAVVAGVFGTATLKSPLTVLQAVLGIIGLVIV